MLMRALCVAILFAGVSNLIAQPFQLTFSGSGSSTTVTTVEVQNLTQGTTLTLNGNDVLELVSVIGTEDIKMTEESYMLEISPNPTSGGCRIVFHNPEEGKVSIELSDLAGKSLIKENLWVPYGGQSFRAEGLPAGICILRIITPRNEYSGMVVTESSGEGNPKISQNTSGYGLMSSMKLSLVNSVVQMQYNPGERLLFKGISGNYTRVLTLVPTQSQAVNFEFIACTDGDGNHYPVVKIGFQTWMAGNLKTTKYNNGTPMPLVTDSAVWVALSTPGYCWYQNDYSTYGVVYGALYNWFAVAGGNLCPVGWHVPADYEWSTLTTNIGGDAYAGGKLKETGTVHWLTPNTLATNETGFSGLPGGYRKWDTGKFLKIQTQGLFWTSETAALQTYAWLRLLRYDYGVIETWDYLKQFGYSVRCVKD